MSKPILYGPDNREIERQPMGFRIPDTRPSLKSNRDIDAELSKARAGAESSEAKDSL